MQAVPPQLAARASDRQSLRKQLRRRGTIAQAVRDRPASIDLLGALAAEVRPLKREEMSAMASVVLHELYSPNPTGERRAPDTVMARALEEHFGSADRWRREFLGIARS